MPSSPDQTNWRVPPPPLFAPPPRRCQYIYAMSSSTTVVQAREIGNTQKCAQKGAYQLPLSQSTSSHPWSTGSETAILTTRNTALNNAKHGQIDKKNKILSIYVVKRFSMIAMATTLLYCAVIEHKCPTQEIVNVSYIFQIITHFESLP